MRFFFFFFFFNDTATTEIYTLSLHDALPIFLEDVERLQQELLFLLDAALQEERLLVQVAVLAHLVTTAHDLTAELGIALDDPARNVPARLDAVAIQHVQDARRAGLRTVRAHGHVQRPLGQRRVAMDPRALPVEIERDGERASLPLRPPDLPLHAYLLSAIDALKLKK